MMKSDVLIRRPVLATVASLVLIVLGTIAFTCLRLREGPNIDPPVVSVTTTNTGASTSARFTHSHQECTHMLEKLDSEVASVASGHGA